MYFRVTEICVCVIICLIHCSIVYGQILRNEHDFMVAANQANKNTIPTAVKNSEFLTSQIEHSWHEIASRAAEALEDLPTDVSTLCLNHTEMFLEAIATKTRQDWALRMIDSMGKPPSELLNYQITWLGSYDECVAIQARVNTSRGTDYPFRGRYCLTSLPLGGGTEGQATLFSSTGPALTIGVCVPNSCSATDTTALLSTLLSLLLLNTTTLPTPHVTCQLESLEYNAKSIIIIIICSIFGLVMTVATAYDVIVVHWLSQLREDDGLPKYERIKEDDQRVIVNGTGKQYGATNNTATVTANGHVSKSSNPAVVTTDEPYPTASQKCKTHQTGTLGKLLLSFSVYSNAKKILSVNQPPGTLTAVNGVRFISMTWVVLGHTYAFGIGLGENTLTFLPTMLKRFTFQVISNATVCVDTFFVLSGLLVSYLSLKEMKKREGAKNFKWGMFYFHRFWRLTPPYMLFLMVYAPLVKYVSDGPVWPQAGFEDKECEGTWWQNLLYINNLVNPEKMCMAWSWYLANDMQFYVLSPLMLVPLYYSPLLGALSCGVLVLICFITTGVISSSDNLSPSILVGNAGESFTEIYVKPWCRIGPYVVGFVAGYVLYKTECKLKLSKMLNMICWATATAIALSVLYGLYDSSGVPHLTNSVSALYNATNRTAWGIAVSWVIVACATGNAGWVNTLLSWKGIIPLSRLTYCAYLVHPAVMYIYLYSRRNLIYFTDLEGIWLFCGHLCITFVAAFVLSLAFESPMMGLEKVLLGRSKNS